jgi:hypothetical protein
LKDPNKLNFALGKGTKGDLNNPNIRGEHGVGLKMVILCSDNFCLWSKTDSGQIFKAEFKDGFKFLQKEESETIENNASVSEIPDGFTTTIKYSFPKGVENILRPIDVRSIFKELLKKYDNVNIHNALNKKNKLELFIEHYFRTSCYTGDVNRIFDNKKPAKIEVIIVKDASIADDQLNKYYSSALIEYWISPKIISFPAKYWDPSEWFPEPSKRGYRLNNQLFSFNPSIKTPDQMWLLKLTTLSEIKYLLNNPHLKQKYPDDYFDDLISHKIRGIYLVIAPASQARFNIKEVMLGEPDQIISADGVITTNQIRTPKRGKNQNYLNNIHFVINVADRVNYGKQGVKNPTLLSKLYEFFEDIYVNKLVELASSVAGKNPAGSPFSIPEISLINLPKILDSDLSIKRIPIIENTLIALTHELIALGRIKGIETYQLHSSAQYDCKGILHSKGVSFVPTRNEDLHSFEYKIKLSALIDEFENGVKDLNDLKLIIVWENDLVSQMTKYTLLDIEYSSYEKMDVTGVTTVLRNVETGHEAPLLIVKDHVTVES